MGWLLTVPVLLPMAAGIALLALRRRWSHNTRRVFLLTVLALNLAATLWLVTRPGLELTLFSLGEGLPIRLCLDGPARLFCSLSSVMFLLVGVYATEYMAHEENPDRFYFFYLIVLGLLAGLGLAGNFLTLYLFFEIMTLFSMPLVLHSLSREAIGAAFKYLFYSIAGASMALIGLFFIYRYGGTLDFTPGGVLDLVRLAGHERSMEVVTLLTIVGLGVKAGMFPLHAWLPTAHPVAPAPASAILSGVITKAGVLAIFRFVYQLVGPDFIRGTWVQQVWLALTLVTILMGSVLAFREPMLKKRLAYSSVSQVSYILFGFATLTTGGLLGGLMHMVFHSALKTAIFLAAGAIIFKTGKTAVHQLRGIGKEMPATLWCFTLIGVTLIGIPPTSGFLSKWHLATGSLAGEVPVFAWLGPVVLLVSALLTAGYQLPISIAGFFPGADYDYGSLQKREASLTMLVPIGLLTAFAVLIGIFPGALTSFLTAIVEAVL